MSKIKMAILGCGGMSGEHAERYKNHPEVEIVALCDVSETLVESYIERHLQHLGEFGLKPQIFTDAAQMYAESKPDAVTIVTPHMLHFEHGMQALDANCHVFMEKPMVTDAKQVYRLAARALETGKIVVVGYKTPCHPNFKYLRALIHENRLGKLETVTAWQSQSWKEMTKGTWRQIPELSGGGQMYDSGAHVFNSLVWLLETPIRDILAFTDNLETPVDINGTVNIRFQNGVLAVVTIAGNCPGHGAGMTLTFEAGRVEIDPWNGGGLKPFRAGSTMQNPEVPEFSQTAPQTPNANFVDAILGRAMAVTSPQNGILQSELMDAIYESARSGQIAHPHHNANSHHNA